MLPTWLTKVMATAILLAWSTNLVMGWFFNRGIESVNIVFGLLAGSVFVIAKKEEKPK